MGYEDPEKIKKAGLYTFGQMLPRAEALVHATHNMNMELFPDNPSAQFRADGAAINMLIGQIMVAACRMQPSLAEQDVQDLFLSSLGNTFEYIREQLDAETG